PAGIESWQVVAFDNGATPAISFPVPGHFVPRFFVESIEFTARNTFDLSGGFDVGRPDTFSGSLTLEAPIEHHRLTVSIQPATDKAQPGDEVEIAVQVTDPEGQPVEDARVTLWAVDQGVLMLEPLTIPDLTESLHPNRYDHMSTTDIRSRLAYHLDFSDPDTTRGFGAGGLGSRGTGRGGGGGMGRAGAASAVPERGNFITTPLYDADLRTNGQGIATTALVLPDNLTRFELRAIAAE